MRLGRKRGDGSVLSSEGSSQGPARHGASRGGDLNPGGLLPGALETDQLVLHAALRQTASHARKAALLCCLLGVLIAVLTIRDWQRHQGVGILMLGCSAMFLVFAVLNLQAAGRCGIDTLVVRVLLDFPQQIVRINRFVPGRRNPVFRPKSEFVRFDTVRDGHMTLCAKDAQDAAKLVALLARRSPDARICVAGIDVSVHARGTEARQAGA